jgi:hypothetical protein
MNQAAKSRVASVLLLLLLMLAPVMEARAADVPPGKALSATSHGIPAIALRAGRSDSRQEIFQAIQEELVRRGISKQGGLRPEDLNIQSSVPALLVDKGLQVKQIRFDPFRREIVFEIRASHSPRFLPFEVTLRDNSDLISRLASGLDEADASLQTLSPKLGKRVGSAQPKPQVLAKPGTLATVIMLGQNVRITIAVAPLQSGVKGQAILVRDVSSARLMTAEVVDENLLQMRF